MFWEPTLVLGTLSASQNVQCSVKSGKREKRINGYYRYSLQIFSHAVALH